MNNNEEFVSPPEKIREPFPWVKTLIFTLQIFFVLGLLVIWLTSRDIQASKNLWVLFFYSFPSEFLIATVPHEPALLYFGKFYSALTVALVAIPSTLLTEMLNYSVFRYITDLKIFRKLQEKKAVQKIIKFFNRSPFLTIWVAGITPIPFYPIRFLVVMTRYPLVKYILAVFLSRFPRFLFLSYLGYKIQFPDYLLAALFVLLILAANISILRGIIKKKKRKKKDAV